jgi:hypothetical protein
VVYAFLAVTVDNLLAQETDCLDRHLAFSGTLLVGLQVLEWVKSAPSLKRKIGGTTLSVKDRRIHVEHPEVISSTLQ